MRHFCTIISPDFLPFAETLLQSLSKHHQQVLLHVLVNNKQSLPQREGLVYYEAAELNAPPAMELVKKYEGYHDEWRWSLKPVFLLHLLQQHPAVIYLDADTCFFDNADFLFEALEKHSILLTPHMASPDPFVNEEKFRMNFLAGLFNAGCVGAGRSGTKTLEWWANACLYKTADAMADGFFVDQRYLDMIPVLDENATIVRHQGCNIGSWNMESRKRITQDDGSILINGKDPVIFIHFNHETIRHILSGEDAALLPYFKKYETFFAATGHQLTDFITRLQQWKTTGFLSELKRNTLIRTRVKRFLFQLAKKL